MTTPSSLLHGTLLDKWRFYSSRYGIRHAICSYIGRKMPRLWGLIGPLATSRYRRRWLVSPGKKILNLGSGSNCIPECLNVDIDPRADVYVDITRLLPFPGNTIDGVFCEEVIEHVESVEVDRMLSECFRILKVRGVIRIITPDPAYLSGKEYNPGSVPSAVAESVLHGHGHKVIYTRSDLASSLEKHGFTAIRQTAYRDGASRLGFLDSHPERFNHAPEFSQYVEAEKPAE